MEAHASRGGDRGEGAILLDVTVFALPHADANADHDGRRTHLSRSGDLFGALVAYPSGQTHAYADLPGAWRVAVQLRPRARRALRAWRARRAPARELGAI